MFHYMQAGKLSLCTNNSYEVPHQFSHQADLITRACRHRCQLIVTAVVVFITKTCCRVLCCFRLSKHICTEPGGFHSPQWRSVLNRVDIICSYAPCSNHPTMSCCARSPMRLRCCEDHTMLRGHNLAKSGPQERPGKVQKYCIWPKQCNLLFRVTFPT